MWLLVDVAIGAGVLLLLGFAAALILVNSPSPSRPTPRDIFGFASIIKHRAIAGDPPAPDRYTARDGTKLAYRFYDSPGERLLVFVHGSSSHGAAYHAPRLT